MSATTDLIAARTGSPTDGALSETIAIRRHAGRHALQAAVGLAIVVGCASTLVLGTLGMIRIDTNPWHWLGTGIGMLAGLAGFLRGMAGMQNADPAVVISPRGLRIDTAVGRRLGIIPWSAIARFERRRHKGRSWIAVHLREESAALREAALGGLLDRLRAELTGSPVTINAHWLRMRADDLLVVLERYRSGYASVG